MKIIFFLFFFVFFITNSYGINEDENYNDLISKLDKIEELVVQGYDIFKKKKVEDNETSKKLILSFIKKVEELKFPKLERLLKHISTVIKEKNGLTYLIERYEEFDELMNMIDFYFDLLRAKLHDMCMHGVCNIPFYLKIENSELNILREVVLGYRKPLQNIKDNLKKIESFVKVNEDTVKKLQQLTTTANETITSKQGSLNGDEHTNVDNRKATYRAQYDILLYNKQLEESQKLIEVLNQHIKKIKENEEIKKLLEKINELSTPEPQIEQNKTKIAELEVKIQDIAKTIELNIDGLFTDSLELEYYLREKKKKITKKTNPEDPQESIDDIMISDFSNEVYPNGIERPMTDNNIKNIIKKDEEESSGNLIDPQYGNPIESEDIFADENSLKTFMNKVKENIESLKQILSHSKTNYDRTHKSYNEEAKTYKPLIEEFYRLKRYNALKEKQVTDLVSKRTSFILSKNKFKPIAVFYEDSELFLEKLEKQYKYLEDFLIKKEFVKREISYYMKLKEKLEDEINQITQNIDENERELLQNPSDIDDIYEDLQINKELLAEKIEDLKNTERLLKNAKFKEKLKVPSVYKSNKKSEPYYLVVIKYEVDKMANLIPKIKNMLETEKGKLAELMKSTTTGETTSPEVETLQRDVTVGGEDEPQTDLGTGTLPQNTVTNDSESSDASKILSPPSPDQVPITQEPTLPVQQNSENTENPVETIRKKIDFFEKLHNFLNTAYICHRKILLSNSTMSESSLEKYQFTDEEKKKLNLCDSSDLLFNIQNKMQVMYSMYDDANNDLQHLYNEMFQKEIIYNLYKLRNNEKINKLLTPSPETETPTSPVAPQADQRTGEQLRRNEVTIQSENVPGQETQLVSGSDETQPRTTAPNGDMQGDENVSGTQGTLDTVENVTTEDHTQDKNIYKSFLLQNETYENEYFKNFVNSNAELIKGMNEQKEQELLNEINELKRKINVSNNNFDKYKLKLDRLMHKRNEILRYRNAIKRVNNSKEQLHKKLNRLNKSKSTLEEFTVYFDKKKEIEKAEIQNLLQNNEALMKHYKSIIKFYSGESSSLKTISDTSIQKENNFINLENFRVISKVEGIKKKNINLEKSNIGYLSSWLHHLLLVLKKLVENIDYSGDNQHDVIVRESLEFHAELIPENPKRKEGEPSGSAVNAETSGVTTNVEAQGTEHQQTTSPSTTDTSNTQGAQQSGASGQGNSGTQGGNTIDSSSQTDSVTAQSDSDQIIEGTSQDDQFDNNVLSGVPYANTYKYLNSIATTYYLRKEIRRFIDTFSDNIIDILESNYAKRSYFLEVLDFDLISYKHASSSDDYIIEDPYKMLEPEKKSKLLGNYKYILASIKKDITFANENIAYFTKMSEKYTHNLEEIKSIIEKKKLQNEKLLPFLTDFNKLYEKLIDSVTHYKSYLNTMIANFEKEKSAMENIVEKITEEKNIDTIIETLKKKKEQDEIINSGSHGANGKLSPNEHNMRKQLWMKFKKLRIINDDITNTLFSNYMNKDLGEIYEHISKHKCLKTVCPINAGCIRRLNGEEECRCFLNYKKDGNICIPDENASCQINNGGCDVNAKCLNNENEISCICKLNGSYPIHGGIFCSSSNFLSISFLLIITLILYNLF
uniref:Merozoite surface protein 1 n=1 Tax=Plasmodium gallinaceum TaxID=5849 RepID=Q4W2V6_PLAGA|nr:merozoite surface protein 1 [Plasmodium gallinaceum]